VIDFDVDGIQRMTLSEEATVTFANPPAEGEYKKVLLDLTANTDPSYEVLEPWSIASADYTNESFSMAVATGSSFPTGMEFKPDGTKMYAISLVDDRVYEFDLLTPWSISSATYSGFNYFPVSAQDNTPLSLDFSIDGTKMYILGEANKRIHEYNLATPWSISSATYDESFFSASVQDTAPYEVAFKPDGDKMYLIGRTNGRIYEYNLATPWSISSGTYSGFSLSVSGQDTDLRAITFKPDGTKMFIVGATNDRVYEYSLATPWSISSGTYFGFSLSVGPQSPSAFDIVFKPDGNKMYIADGSNSFIFEYNTSQIVQFSSLQWPSNLEWEDGTPPTLPALTETALIEIEARTDYLGTNYIGRLVGRNF